MKHIPDNGYTFEEYVLYASPSLIRARLLAAKEYSLPEPQPEILERHNLGTVAYRFIWMLAPDPYAIFDLEPASFNAYFLNKEFNSWLEKYRIIHCEDMENELSRFLVDQGCQQEILPDVFSAVAKNQSQSSEADHNELWTDDLRQFFYDQNWIAFEMFPEYRLQLPKNLRLKNS